jgi:hypothetical protein
VASYAEVDGHKAPLQVEEAKALWVILQSQ